MQATSTRTKVKSGTEAGKTDNKVFQKKLSKELK